MSGIQKKNFLWVMVMALAIVLPAACVKSPERSEQASKHPEVIKAVETEKLDESRQKAEDYHIGQVRMNPHPASLEGKTVVLRWNGKFNGDILLNNLAGLLSENMKGVKVVKMWEEEPSTAMTSYNQHNTELFSEKIAALKPDLVIASSADGDRCSAWLTIDQLNLEKKGIPTVTITTTVFESAISSVMKEQGISGMAVVAVEHPIAGRNAEDTRKLAEGMLAEVLEAAMKWQPSR